LLRTKTPFLTRNVIYEDSLPFQIVTYKWRFLFQIVMYKDRVPFLIVMYKEFLSRLLCTEFPIIMYKETVPSQNCYVQKRAFLTRIVMSKDNVPFSLVMYEDTLPYQNCYVQRQPSFPDCYVQTAFLSCQTCHTQRVLIV